MMENSEISAAETAVWESVVNGSRVRLILPETKRLLDVLREDLGLTGVKRSCDIGRCGACMVLLDGEPVNACLTMAYQANGKQVTTIEGIAADGLHPVQQAFLEEGGYQCGYCTPGMVISAVALLNSIDQPSADEIQEALSGNLCRCTGYAGIIRSVQRAAEMMEAEKVNSGGGINMPFIQELNVMDQDSFVRLLGTVFEHSPWVAEKAWLHRPFISLEHLHSVMMARMTEAPEERLLALLRAHPDLAGKIKAAELTADSSREQQGAGLDRLTPEEQQRFLQLNSDYTAKFGFPFIMAVAGCSKADILKAMEERVKGEPAAEWNRAVEEIGRITNIRLNRLAADQP